MNYQRRLRRTKFYLLNLLGEEKSRPIPRTNSIIVVSSLHLFSHGKMDHVLITEYLEQHSLDVCFKKIHLSHIKLRIENC
jgi:hypothetical protein